MTDPRVAEQTLVDRARAGDEEAFGELVAANADRVLGVLRRYGLTGEEADEVAQEVFLRAWRGLARFEGRAKLSTWLYRIAFNEAHRRLARRPPPSAAPGADGADPIDAVADAPQRGPEGQALDHEFEATLRRALAELPDDWRAAVVLRDIEGLSTDDAAGVVGVGPAAFKSRLHRGRMQLRVLLEPYVELEQP